MPESRPIIRLPDVLIDRIAAGEVIERPAAAVKELVENALDAGATRIVVRLTGGGIERIEIVDDGAGMGRDDLSLAVQRHCTSKLLADLSQGDALSAIRTLGFRGEALPSIGAAARLSITSRPDGATHAWAITVEGGDVSACAPAAGPPGTRVVVADLFFATPARRKFLKSPRIEADHAEAAVRRLALASPRVAIRLELDGAVALDLPVQERDTRVAALLGAEPAAAMRPVETVRDGARLSGFACAPTIHRASGAAQYLAVNGRPVVDPVLKTAVRVAYRDVIVAGRHPVVALFLDLPADSVDVNVHPAKTELRYADPAAIRALVIGGLRASLAGGAASPSPARPTLRLVSNTPGRPAIGPRYVGFAESQLPLATGPAARALPAPAPAPADHPLGASVAQVLDTYILAVAADGSLILVDQHAAHERLTQEALAAQVAAGAVRSQPLLLPSVVDLPQADAARLLARAGEFAAFGMEFEAFGPGAILVRALPAVLGAADPAPLLRDLAEELAEWDEATALAARLDAVVARLACHGSIRAGRRLSQPEMDALLRQMETSPRAATCSHGRPTFVRLSRAEIERLFGRR